MPTTPPPSPAAPPENVDPAALMALPGDYAGRTVSFTVKASGGLRRESNGTSSVYLDDYFHLNPILQGDVVRKWLKAGFSPDGVYNITFIGQVQPDPNTPFVNFKVEDFSIN